MNEEENLLNEICEEAETVFPKIGLTFDFEDMVIFTVYKSEPKASDGLRVFDTRGGKQNEMYSDGIHKEFIAWCHKHGYIPKYGEGNSSHWVRLLKRKQTETI